MFSCNSPSLTLPLLPFISSPLSFLFYCLSSVPLLLFFSSSLFSTSVPPLLSDGLVIHSSSQALIHFNIIILPECSSLSSFLFHPYFISQNSSTSSDLLIIPPPPSSPHVHSVVSSTIKPITVFKLTCSGG